MIGIDFGRQHCVIARFSDAGPEVLTDSSGSYLIPTAVAVAGGRVVAGREARRCLDQYPDAGHAAFRDDCGTDCQYESGGRTWTPTECAAHLFGHLSEIAGKQDEPVVIAVPAWFHDGQRGSVVEAARDADLNVWRLINQATAAAIAYCYENPNNRSSVMVLDLADAQFDVSLLRIRALDFELLSTNGVSQIEPSVYDDPPQLFETIAAPIRQALKDSGTSAHELDDILLVGESPQLAGLNERIESEFGRPGKTSVNPDQAVAIGAAVYARAFSAKHQEAGSHATGKNEAGEFGCLSVVLASMALVLAAMVIGSVIR